MLDKSRHCLRVLASVQARACEVPAALFHRLIDRESRWNANARGRHGERGLAQIKPGTLRDVSPYLDIESVSDRLLGAACYLRQMYDRERGTVRERWTRALHSYNAGPRGIRTAAVMAYADDIMESNE